VLVAGVRCNTVPLPAVFRLVICSKNETYPIATCTRIVFEHNRTSSDCATNKSSVTSFDRPSVKSPSMKLPLSVDAAPAQQQRLYPGSRVYPISMTLIHPD
jgi:hypothetical protein